MMSDAQHAGSAPALAASRAMWEADQTRDNLRAIIQTGVSDMREILATASSPGLARAAMRVALTRQGLPNFLLIGLFVEALTILAQDESCPPLDDDGTGSQPCE